MALQPDEERTLHAEDLDGLEHVVADLEAAAQGWINLLPEVEPGNEPPPRRPVVAIFSSRGDPIPLATWSAPPKPGGRPSIGIQHGSGPQALARLTDAGLPLPDGWFKAADHPRRGLVVTVPPSSSARSVLDWLLGAATELSTVPLTGHWLAQIYR
jgi:hypothetical protein